MVGYSAVNQAVALAQLGARAAVLGVLADDPAAERVLAQARADRVDVSWVINRAGSALLTTSDIAGAARLLSTARATVVGLREPPAAALAAVRYAKGANRLVVVHGAPADDNHRAAILDTADVLRVDAGEAARLTGYELRTADDALAVGGEVLIRHRLRLVALAVHKVGNVFVWNGGQEAIPLLPNEIVDTSGSEDAFVAGLTCALLRGRGLPTAARLAVAAEAATVSHAGAWPRLTSQRLAEYVIRLNLVAPLAS